MVNITIDGKNYSVDEKLPVLDILQSLDLNIPTFCNDERFERKLGICGMCSVLIDGTITKSCKTLPIEGMIIDTQTSEVIENRRKILQNYIDNHYVNCLVCQKAGQCELQKYCYEYGIDKTIPNSPNLFEIDDSNPFFQIDPNKCIGCGKCAEICRNLQCNHALKLKTTNGKIHTWVNKADNINNSTCASCGNCVSFCPTAGLLQKYKNEFRHWETKMVKTTCGYCGVGCQIDFEVKDNTVVAAHPVLVKPNAGLLCVKGKFGYSFINHPDRLTHPLIKENGIFRKASWDEALTLITKKLSSTMKEYNNEGIAAFSSAKCTNEENYLYQKFFRGVIKTNNVDHCSRLCHSSSSAALGKTLGYGAMSNSVSEGFESKAVLISGENIRESHPVLGTKIKHSVQNGAKLIIIDIRDIDISEIADVFLKINPGTDIALINAMINVIISENLHNKEYLANNTIGFEAVKECVKNYTPEYAAKVCGVSADDIVKAARIYASDVASIYLGMGNTQHINGTDNVISLSNLALICGNVGKEKGGVNPLRGQNNAQGACDMGAFPEIYSGYQKVDDPKVREKMEKYWNVENLSPFAGITIVEIIDKIAEGEIKFLYVMGENPLMTDPNVNHVRKALKKLDFFVVQDIFLTETAQMADVVLPATCFAEKVGTFTNTGRRVQRVRQVVTPPGEAKTDLDIIIELMDRMGYKQINRTPEAIFNELCEVTPLYNGYNYAMLEKEGLQWPVIDGKGTEFLYEDLSDLKRKFELIPVELVNSVEVINEEYPYYLSTGRVLYQFHTRTMTGKVEGLNEKCPEPYVEMNPIQMAALSKKNGDMVTIRSRRGEINVKIKQRDGIKDGVVFVPFHFSSALVNELTESDFLGPLSKTPEYKICPVKIV
ncbi:formate dehydrogenase subunit alpha [Cetobacterium sp.]